jgi:mannose-6-phosphate isomerase-like protein (cupin superfamily)
MSSLFDLSTIAWKPVRPEITTGVFGRLMLDGNVKAVLTRVEPGGKFTMHADSYAHLFYFLAGEGTVWIGDKQSPVRTGTVVQVDAGEMHAYENAGKQDLILLSMNIP